MLATFLLVCLVKVSLAEPNGAPSQSCKHMLPGHVSLPGVHGIPIIQQPESSSPYVINATWDPDRKHVTVTVTGGDLRGFLIQARPSTESDPIGTFVIDERLNVTKYQDCTGKPYKFSPQSSITHQDSSIKKNLTVLWKPPKNKHGNVTFYVTTAKSFRVFWQKLHSNAVQFSSGSRNALVASFCLNILIPILSYFLSTRALIS